MSIPEYPTFDEWLKMGFDLGFCGPPVCPDHDGIPMSFAEETILESDGEWCTHIVRLYQDRREKLAVERHHSPSVWRALNLGWGNLPGEADSQTAASTTRIHGDTSTKQTQTPQCEPN